MRTRPLLLPLVALAFLLPAPRASAAITTVTQSGFAFSPASVTISVGDTVRWVWSSGTHTVTNGATMSDPALGTLFNSPLTSANRTFLRRFTTTGVVPYLCELHFDTFGMAGTVTVRAPTGVGDSPAARLDLRQNSPNPFNPMTRIEFTLAGPEGGVPVALRVYDTQGRLVRTLVNEVLSPGLHSAVWNGRDDAGRVLSSGIYVYRLEADGRRTSRSMTLLK